MAGTPSLSNDEIAVLSDIAQNAMKQGAGRSIVARLQRDGLIEPDNDGAHAAVRYRLTRKGETFLTSRGAGLNEA